MKWVRKYHRKNPTDWKGNIRPNSKAYTSRSQWHLLHSIRAGSVSKYSVDVPFEFVLTFDGFWFESDKVQISEKPKGDFCSNCYAVYQATTFSVQLDDNS